MFLFIRLVLAHFLGDFPLQFDTIYKLKFQGVKGIVPHVLIIGGCSLALSWPYLHVPGVWAFIALITVVHLIEDSVKLSFKTKKFSFWTYVLDQLIHLGTIALMFFTGLKDLQPPDAGNALLIRIYNNDHLALFLIALIIATYNGHFMIRCFKDTFLPRASQCYMHEKWFGMAERGMIIALVYAQLPWMAVIPAGLLLRPVFYGLFKKKLSLHTCFISRIDTILSLTMAFLVAAGLRLLQTRYPVY